MLGWTFLHKRGWRSECVAGQRDVDVFKKNSAGNAADAIARFHQVVSRLAGMFTSERIGEDKGMGKLTSAHEETRAIRIPVTFFVHDFSPLWQFRVQNFLFVV